MFQNNQVILLYNCFGAELSPLFLPKITLDKQFNLYNNSFGEAQKSKVKLFLMSNSMKEIKHMSFHWNIISSILGGLSPPPNSTEHLNKYIKLQIKICISVHVNAQ